MNLITTLNNPNIIEVFSMEPKKEILKYKKQYIETIPYGERLLEAYTDIEKPLESDEIEIRYSDIDSFGYDRWGGGPFHYVIAPRISEEEYKTLCKSLIDRYLKGEFKSAKAKRIVYSTLDQLKYQKEKQLYLMRYLLITEKYSSGNDLMNGKKMSNILRLTRELFLLQMIESAEFKYIAEEEIDEQLSLFDISPVARVNMSDVTDLIGYGIIKPDAILAKIIEGSNLILAKIKNMK